MNTTEAIFSFNCPSCGSRLSGKPKHVGRSMPCPKCKGTLTVPESPNTTQPATDKQKAFAIELGIEFPDDIAKDGLSKMIDAAVLKQDDDRYLRMNELQKVESEVREQLRAEVQAEYDEEDPRLSKASVEQILEALQLRDIGAIMITFDYGLLSGVDDLTGEKFALNSTDDIDETDMATIVSSLGIALVRNKHRGQ